MSQPYRRGHGDVVGVENYVGLEMDAFCEGASGYGLSAVDIDARARREGTWECRAKIAFSHSWMRAPRTPLRMHATCGPSQACLTALSRYAYDGIRQPLDVHLGCRQPSWGDALLLHVQARRLARHEARAAHHPLGRYIGYRRRGARSAL